MKTVRFITLGCKVNQYDTQSIRERFLGLGYKEVNKGRAADICVINTCTVTQSADNKSRHMILKSIKEKPKPKIIVTGCLVKNDYSKLERLNGIDFIVSKSFFPERISEFSGHTRAFLKVQDGCDNFCSYCKVPFVRGRSRSRPMAEIMREAEELVKNGFKEIVVSGICLGSYGKELPGKISLTDVIENIAAIKGLLRIRLSSIEAKDITEELINKFRECGKLCRHLHIPVQSGDDAILKRMNRSYRSKYYLGLIRKIKRKVPGIAVTTDVMAGFPGETEKNFNNTLKLIKAIQPLRAHIFPYSRRQNTSACGLKGAVSQESIAKRLLKLNNAAQNCSETFKKKFLNKEMDVLIEGRAKDDPAYFEGYTDNYIKVRLKSRSDLKNKLVTAKLNMLQNDFMLGSINK